MIITRGRVIDQLDMSWAVFLELGMEKVVGGVNYVKSRGGGSINMWWLPCTRCSFIAFCCVCASPIIWAGCLLCQSHSPEFDSRNNWSSISPYIWPGHLSVNVVARLTHALPCFSHAQSSAILCLSVKLFNYLFFHRRPTRKLCCLSCRPFVVNATFWTDLVVSSVSWLGQLTVGV